MTVRLAKAHLKKKKKVWEKRRGRSCPCQERDQKACHWRRLSMELADQPDLAPMMDRGIGQRERWAMGFNFFVLEYITKSMVMICLSVKICDFLFSFFFFLFFFFSISSVYTMSEPCRHHVKKKKKDKESSKLYRYPCSTCVGHQYVAKNGMSVQPSG